MIKKFSAFGYTKSRKDLISPMQNEFAEEYKKIGLKIAYYRKLKGWTQEQLADQLNVATNFIGQIEAPNIYKPISMHTLFRIAKALEVPAYKILDFD